MPTPGTRTQSAHRANSADSVRSYLREIGRIPLLTAEQELIYGKQVQQMMALVEAKAVLAQSLEREPTLAEWAEQVGLAEDALDSTLVLGQRAKHRMIEANLRLVVSVAKKYLKRNMEFLDLIQEGSLGLERGIEKFDPRKGYKLSTYAYWWIRQSITRAIATHSRTVRLPIHVNEILNKIKKAQKELAQHLGRSATPSEIAQALELEPAKVRDYLLIARQPISLDLRVGESKESELGDLLEADGISPEEYISKEALRSDLQCLLLKLSLQQQEVMSLRFGLADGKARSLQEIGEQLHLSRERIRQIETQALNRLRRHRASVQDYCINDEYLRVSTSN